MKCESELYGLSRKIGEKVNGITIGEMKLSGSRASWI